MGATKEEVVVLAMGDSLTDLPPGFRFHPTDEEIITHYLCEKVRNKGFISRAIGEVDLNRCEPWDLPSKAKMGEKEWYFFCQRDRKYPTGMRTNRATETGYWKATGKDKEIYKGRNNLVGMKKTLVFYMGRAPKGEKTNWVMHEYRLEGKSLHYNAPRCSKDDWVVCRVFHKNAGLKKGSLPELERVDSFAMNFVNEFLESPPLPALLESPYGNSSKLSSSLVDDGDGGDVKKAAATAIPINPSHLPSSSTMDNRQTPQRYLAPNNTYPSNHHRLDPCNAAQEAMFYPQAAPIMTPYHHSLPPTSAPNTFYNLHQQERNPGLASYQTAPPDFTRCYPKVEQHSNQSLVSASQDTVLSTDRNTESSSVVSKPELNFPSCSAGAAADLVDLWGY